MASPAEPAAKLEFFNKTNEQMDAAIRPRRPLSLAAASQAEVGKQDFAGVKGVASGTRQSGWPILAVRGTCAVPATPAGSPAKWMSRRWGFS